jgi:hypothetical protein
MDGGESKLTILNMASKSKTPQNTILAINSQSSLINLPQSPPKKPAKTTSSISPGNKRKEYLDTYVNQPPNPSTETCSPEFPTLLYNMPVFLGSGHAIFVRACEPA